MRGMAETYGLKDPCVYVFFWGPIMKDCVVRPLSSSRNDEDRNALQ